MKSLTEFPFFTLNRGLALRAELAAAGKSPEEIEQGLGEAMKLEGEKLKYFVEALTLIEGKAEGLKRVMVLSFSEGESVLPKAQKVGEHHYLPEYHQDPKARAASASGKSGDRKGGRGKGRGQDRDRGRDGGGRGNSPRGKEAAKSADRPIPLGEKAPKEAKTSQE